MSHYAIVIDDAAKHYEAAMERQFRYELGLKPTKFKSRVDEMIATNQALKEARRKIGGPKEANDLHTVAEVECPEGLLNCRNCGDPAFAQECEAAGHCPYCGSRHGIAPDSYLARSGVSMQRIDIPEVEGIDRDIHEATERAKRSPIVATTVSELAELYERRGKASQAFFESHEWSSKDRKFVLKK